MWLNPHVYAARQRINPQRINVKVWGERWCRLVAIKKREKHRPKWLLSTKLRVTWERKNTQRDVKWTGRETVELHYEENVWGEKSARDKGQGGGGGRGREGGDKATRGRKIDKSGAGKNIYLYKNKQHRQTQQPPHADLHTPAVRLPLIKAALIVLKMKHSPQATSQAINPLITSATRRPRLIFLFLLRLFFPILFPL